MQLIDLESSSQQTIVAIEITVRFSRQEILYGGLRYGPRGGKKSYRKFPRYLGFTSLETAKSRHPLRPHLPRKLLERTHTYNGFQKSGLRNSVEKYCTKRSTDERARVVLSGQDATTTQIADMDELTSRGTTKKVRERGL